MEKKYRVVSSGEFRTQDDAEALARKLADLGIASQIRVDEFITELLPLDQGQLTAIGSINFSEFCELMNQIGTKPERAKQMWGDVLRWTPFISNVETPLYEVDTEAILAKAKPKNRASRKHFEWVAEWEERLAKTSLDLTLVAQEIQSDELINRVCIGPKTVDSLTMIINQRASQIAGLQEPEISHES